MSSRTPYVDAYWLNKKKSKQLGIRALLICNAYPSDTNLYRNGFIHRRVKAYKQAGMEVEVYFNHEPVKDEYNYSFDNINVVVGNEYSLTKYLASNHYDVFLVHFAEPSRVRPLFVNSISEPVIVWVHGFEAEAWHRRWFNFIETPETIREALLKKDSYYLHQNDFFRHLMTTNELNVSFVNVSSWFQKFVVEPDIGAKFTDSVVIPNLIDGVFFDYNVKSEDMRLKILSIRPYASHKYANDQMVQAILELSNRPYFQNLEFEIYGDGPLFKDITAPLNSFSNVSLHETFLRQEEIVQAHKKNGVFLCPTRFDSQGVSMGEAMSSGLVPITTNIAAIPEYVSHRNTGLLSSPEDSTALADSVEELYYNPELFLTLSRNAAEWVREHCGNEATTAKEIELIVGKVRHGRK